MTLDRTDRRILNLLQEEGRISNVELAKRVNLSPSPCLERVKRLEQNGYIDKYVALLNPVKLGTNLLAFIEVHLKSTATSDTKAFNDEILQLDEVESCHMVAGGFDYLIKLRCRDMEHYRHFLGEKLASIPLITQTHTYVVIQEVKSETAIKLPPVDND